MHTVARRVKQQRWQPYTQPQNYLATPASSSASNSPSPSLPDRKPSSKSIASIALIERAVTSLNEIWPEGEAQALFATMPYIQAQSSTPSVFSVPPAHRATANMKFTTQLPSPISPSTSPQRFQHIPKPVPSAILDQVSARPFDTQPTMPLRGFVHELLRRSRTSLAVLQTALCYVEAARAHVPAIRQGRASFADLPASTITVSDEHPPAPAPANADIEAMPEGPHPLLCARRTFLASLLLAHKFTADKAFSNKAWARLTNLPAREVGRCERALGGVLGWRLWVGKPNEVQRTASLCRSASAPESYFEPADIRMQEAPPPLSRGLSRAATEPSLGGLPTVVVKQVHDLTYSPEQSCSNQIYNRNDDEAYGQRTIRVDDEDDESTAGSSMDFTNANHATTMLQDWVSQSSNGGDSSEVSTPALSPASSTMSGSSSGSEFGPDFASIPTSWVQSSMKDSFSSDYPDPRRFAQHMQYASEGNYDHSPAAFGQVSSMLRDDIHAKGDWISS